MKHALPFTLTAALLAAPAVADETTEAAADLPTAGEIELAELLEGREAGEPVRCLRHGQRDRLTVVDNTALVFRDGKTLYVNRPKGARFLNDWDIPVFHQFSSSLCALDRVEMHDRFSRIGGPVLFLGEFVPYTKPAKEG